METKRKDAEAIERMKGQLDTVCALIPQAARLLARKPTVVGKKALKDLTPDDCRLLGTSFYSSLVPKAVLVSRGPITVMGPR